MFVLYRPLTQQEVAELQGWSFIRSYNKYRTELLELATGIYSTLCGAFNGHPPTQDQFYWFYWKRLKSTNLYLKKIAEPKFSLSPSLYDYYADLLTRYIMENNRQAITSAPCP